MLILLLLFSTLIASHHVDAAVEFQIGSKGKQANLDRFDGTCGRNDVILSMAMHSIDFDGTNIYFNYTFFVNESIADMTIKYKLTSIRCLSKENPDTCESFFVHNFKNYCDVLQSKNPLWYQFYSKLEPPMRCPIKKGRYRGINSKVSVGAYLIFPIGSYYWKIKIELSRMNGQTIFCTIAEAQISVTRSSSLF